MGASFRLDDSGKPQTTSSAQGFNAWTTYKGKAVLIGSRFAFGPATFLLGINILGSGNEMRSEN